MFISHLLIGAIHTLCNVKIINLPGLQWQLDTPNSVLHLSFCAWSHVESSPTMHVSIRTGGCCGGLWRYRVGGKLDGFMGGSVSTTAYPVPIIPGET